MIYLHRKQKNIDRTSVQVYNLIIATLGIGINTSYFPLDVLIAKGDDSDMVFKEGTSVFIIESNRLVREVVIVKRTGNLYVIKFADNNGGIQVRGSRLFSTRDEAEKSVPNVRESKKRYLSPYEYLH